MVAAAHSRKKSLGYGFVLDCSVTMAWLFEDESSAETDKILENLRAFSAVVPSIWPLEVANVLLMAQRKKRITTSQASNFIDALTILPIVVDETTSVRAMHSIFRLAENLHISIYDAAYLELALREKIPLATLDKELIVATHRAGHTHI